VRPSDRQCIFVVYIFTQSRIAVTPLTCPPTDLPRLLFTSSCYFINIFFFHSIIVWGELVISRGQLKRGGGWSYATPLSVAVKITKNALTLAILTCSTTNHITKWVFYTLCITVAPHVMTLTRKGLLREQIVSSGGGRSTH